MRTTVYTAIFGDYDNLKVPTVVELGISYVVLTDWKKALPYPWLARAVSRKHADARRESRRYKLLAHQFFPDADITLWHGGNIQLRQKPRIMVEDMLGDADIAAFKHPHRDCLYDEAKICLDWKLDEPGRINRQMNKYRNEGFPEHFGLTACWFMIRRNTKVVQEFCDLWWSELDSVRDQLSFDYVRWKTGIRVKWIPGCLIGHPWLARYNHK